jgi:hypothetical protein
MQEDNVRIIKFTTILIGLLLFPLIAFTQNISDYLILQDISSYLHKVQTKDFRTLQLKTIPDYTITNNSGVLMGTDHFLLDHNDKTYETDYESDVTDIGIEVQVTQHTGGDSDLRLLHELDAEFRTYYGIPDLTYTIKIVDGNRILVDATGGRDYRWISGNKVIQIEYNDLQMTKLQPLEVVQAYLAKHPSTLPSMTLLELRGNTNVTKWIKDEMDRRLWLCDKWNAQSQAGSVTQADLIYNLVRSMNVFLNYRQKYYGVSAKDDLDLLSSYKENKDITSIQSKLTEYKTWWNANKGKNIKI